MSFLDISYVFYVQTTNTVAHFSLLFLRGQILHVCKERCYLYRSFITFNVDDSNNI